MNNPAGKPAGPVPRDGMQHCNIRTGFMKCTQMSIKLNFKPAVTMNKTVFLLPFLLVCMLMVSETEAGTQVNRQSAPVALVGGTIHTLAGEKIENGTVLFEDGVITAIGTDVELPEGVRREDVTDRHIYPGLIDAWNRIGIYEIGAVEMTHDINEQGPVNPNVMVERAFNPESRHIGVARSAGVLTSVTSPGGGLISGQSAAMKMDGWTWDEMTLRSGVGLIVNWPNPSDEDDYTERLSDLRSVFADARAYRAARNAMEAGKASRLDHDSRWHAMIPVLDGERPVVVNADEVRQIQDAITWADEEDLRLVILGGRDAHLVSDHLRNKNVPVIITTVLSAPGRTWEGYDSQYTLPAKLYEAGVEFAISGSSSAANVNRLPYEAGAAAAFGLPEAEALKAITVYPAAILGLDDRIGTLEAGKDATLMITSGNPMEYSTQIEQVYIQGRKSDMMDKHRRLYEKYKQKPGMGR